MRYARPPPAPRPSDHRRLQRHLAAFGRELWTHLDPIQGVLAHITGTGLTNSQGVTIVYPTKPSTTTIQGGGQR